MRHLLLRNNAASYYRARYYDFQVGRFLSEDPLLHGSDTINFYAYSANNGVRYRDPFGTCIIEMYVVPTGANNEGHLYHSFLVLYDNTGKSGASPAFVFRGGPAPGTPPNVQAEFGPLRSGVRGRTLDQPSDSVFQATLLSNECGCRTYLNSLTRLISDIDQSKIAYTPWHNSNTVTSTAIDFLGLPKPNVPGDVRWRLWGWGNTLIPSSGGGW